MSSSTFPVTDDTFSTEVLDSDVPVLVDFWAEWCGPCRMVGPVLEEIASERAGSLKVAKVDVDSNPGLAQQFSIQSIPTMLVFRGGQPVKAIVGARPKAAIEAELADL